jgi:hypothetical protein
MEHGRRHVSYMLSVLVMICRHSLSRLYIETKEKGSRDLRRCPGQEDGSGVGWQP